MSRSDWFKHPKTRLIGGLLVAVIFCAVWIGYGLLQSVKYERQARANTAEYTRYAREKVAQTCVGIPRVEAIKCLYDARDRQREYHYNQQDLVAQRQSALWAYIMAAAAIFGMMLSAVGVWLVYGTWKQTAVAADSARKTLSAYVAKERAILVIRGADYRHLETLPYPNCVLAKLENRGTSPARTSAVAWEYLDGPVWPEKLQFSKFDDGIIAVGSTGPSAVMTSDTEAIDGKYLAVQVDYYTVEQGPFQCFAAFKIEIVDGAGYTTDRHQITQTYIAGVPVDT